jgi:hypothetical protein
MWSEKLLWHSGCTSLNDWNSLLVRLIISKMLLCHWPLTVLKDWKPGVCLLNSWCSQIETCQCLDQQDIPQRSCIQWRYTCKNKVTKSKFSFWNKAGPGGLMIDTIFLFQELSDVLIELIQSMWSNHFTAWRAKTNWESRKKRTPPPQKWECTKAHNQEFFRAKASQEEIKEEFYQDSCQRMNFVLIGDLAALIKSLLKFVPTAVIFVPPCKMMHKLYLNTKIL